MVRYDFENDNYKIYNDIKKLIPNDLKGFELCRYITTFINKNFSYNGSNPNLYKSKELLDLMHKKDEIVGINCFHMATLLCELLLTYKFKTRFIHIYPKNAGESHCLVEVFLYEKWIALDPTFDIFFQHNDQFLNVIELFDCINKSKEIKINLNNKSLNDAEIIDFYKRQSDLVITYENNTFEAISAPNQKFIVLLNYLDSIFDYFMKIVQNIEALVLKNPEFKELSIDIININKKKAQSTNYTNF